MFIDRFHAGRKLALRLKEYSRSDAVNFAIPRGGIQIGKEVAGLLGLPLEVVLTKKLGRPFQP